MSAVLPARNMKTQNAIDNYNKIVKETCIDLGVEYVDSSPILLSDTGRIRQDLHFDIIHLSNKGHILFAKELNKFILNSIVADADETDRQSTEKSILNDESDPRNISQSDLHPVIKNQEFFNSTNFLYVSKKTPTPTTLSKSHIFSKLRT